MSSPGRQGAVLKRPLRTALEFPLGILSILLLAGLALLTCVDVVARYWFNSPVNGAYELTEMMLCALVFSALPMTTARGEHVEVDLFASMAGRHLRRFLYALGNAISALVLFALSWRLGVHGARLVEEGAVTNSLELPLGPLGYAAALSCCLSGLVALFRIFSEAPPSGEERP